METYNAKTGILQITPLTLPDEYRKKWNVTSNDFYCLTIDGELVSDSIYRVGMFTCNVDSNHNYYMLLKQVEAMYSRDISKQCNLKTEGSRRYLDSVCCIIDKYGKEKVVFSPFQTTYLVKDSCLYTHQKNYFNIETGHLYGNGTAIQSDDFLFLQNEYDIDKAKRGVLKINKKDGTFELFPITN